MCGRFNLTENPRTLADVAGLANMSDLRMRLNVAPSQLIPVVSLKSGRPARGLGWPHALSRGVRVNANPALGRLPSPRGRWLRAGGNRCRRR